MKKWVVIRIALGFALIIILATPGGMVLAGSLLQGEEPDGPVYIVQPGDSLWDIAARFKVAMDELASANGITDPGQLAAGARLIIPGLSGVDGVLTTRQVSYGETLRSLSRRYQVPVEILARLNHLASPEELYAGSTLIVPEQNASAGASQRRTVMPGQSLLELAAAQGVSPWSFVIANNLPGTWSVIPGEVLHLPQVEPATGADTQPGALPEAITAVSLAPFPMVQGEATILKIDASEGISLTGSLAGREMSFFPDGKGSYYSLQGIHAMQEPGVYSLTLTGTLPTQTGFGNTTFGFSQSVLVSPGSYPYDPVLTVSPETIDPAVTKPEDAQWAALTATATPEKLWEGLFTSPAPPPYSDCWPSTFGNRRSYNGSEYVYFHSGLDFCGGVGTEILAPASGRVVFAGPLTVRGNATIIDHGWGVYTGYLHQSEILVSVGEMVQPGQVIGKVGGTGRVTGPHLHWEIWAGGVQVNPLDWLQEIYPE